MTEEVKDDLTSKLRDKSFQFTREARDLLYSEFVGKRFKHTGNGKVYIVYDVQWDGRSDQWALAHYEVVAQPAGSWAPTITRTVSDFFGDRYEVDADEKTRFIKRFERFEGTVGE